MIWHGDKDRWYSSGYREARPVDEQIAILQQYDWGRKVDWTLNAYQQAILMKPVPKMSEGYFVVVFDFTMVTHFNEDPLVDQSISVNRALCALHNQLEGYLVNHYEGKLGPQYYTRNKKSAEKMKQLWESQGCPTGIILIPAQLGIAHRAEPILQAYVAMRGSEFPLDAYETIQMLLTHENRLKNQDDLWLDLPGAEYDTSGKYWQRDKYCSRDDDAPISALCLRFNHPGILLCMTIPIYSLGHCGSVSGFLLE